MPQELLQQLLTFLSINVLVEVHQDFHSLATIKPPWNSTTIKNCIIC